MPLASPSTAEHVIAAVEAVLVNGATTSVDVVAEFLGTTLQRATAALELAVELGLLSSNGNTYGSEPTMPFYVCSRTEGRCAAHHH
jgi:hypothetical protein